MISGKRFEMEITGKLRAMKCYFAPIACVFVLIRAFFCLEIACLVLNAHLSQGRRRANVPLGCGTESAGHGHVASLAVIQRSALRNEWRYGPIRSCWRLFATFHQYCTR